MPVHVLDLLLSGQEILPIFILSSDLVELSLTWSGLQVDSTTWLHEIMVRDGDIHWWSSVLHLGCLLLGLRLVNRHYLIKKLQVAFDFLNSISFIANINIHRLGSLVWVVGRTLRTLCIHILHLKGVSFGTPLLNWILLLVRPVEQTASFHRVLFMCWHHPGSHSLLPYHEVWLCHGPGLF